MAEARPRRLHIGSPKLLPDMLQPGYLYELETCIIEVSHPASADEVRSCLLRGRCDGYVHVYHKPTPATVRHLAALLESFCFNSFTAADAKKVLQARGRSVYSILSRLARSGVLKHEERGVYRVNKRYIEVYNVPRIPEKCRNNKTRRLD